jgi:hypothetical protein
LPTWTRAVRLVAAHAALREALGATPSVHAVYRFTLKLREHSAALADCLDRVVASLRDHMPDLGQDIAIDASDMPACANGMPDLPNGKPRERYSDPDVTWGNRSAISTPRAAGSTATGCTLPCHGEAAPAVHEAVDSLGGWDFRPASYIDRFAA